MPFEALPLSVFLQGVIDDTASGVADVRVEIDPDAGEDEPGQRPEILRGLGNLIQNADQFARSVSSCRWGGTRRMFEFAFEMMVPAFQPACWRSSASPIFQLVPSAGITWVSRIFIAQSLLERSGATLSFRNRGGGVVAISWPRSMLDLTAEEPETGH